MQNHQKPKRSFKIFAILIAITLLGLQFYVLMLKDITALGSDEWNWLPLVRDGFKGEFSFKDYWDAHGGHRVFGYKTLLTLNAMFLGLDLRYFQYGGVILWTIGALIASFWLNKKLEFGHVAFTICAALMIVTTLISPHAWTNSEYSVIAWRFGNILGFMLIFIVSDKLIYEKEGRKNFIRFSLLVFIYTLIFGRGWGQAMLYSALFFLIIGAIVQFKLKDFRKLRWLAAAIFVGFFAIFIYNLGGENLVAKAKEPISLRGFYNFTTGLMGNTLGFDFIGRKNFESRSVIQLLGLFSISIYAIACLLYLRSGLYKKTAFPLMIMAFSTVAILAAYYGRGLSIGEKAAYYPRWVGESCLGLAGALAILFHARYDFMQRINSKNLKTLSSAVLLILSGGIFYTHGFAVKESIRTAVYVHKFDENLLEATFSKPLDVFVMDKSLRSKSLCRTPKRCELRQILDEHDLIPGSDRYRPKDKEPASPLDQ